MAPRKVRSRVGKGQTSVSLFFAVCVQLRIFPFMSKNKLEEICQ